MYKKIIGFVFALFLVLGLNVSSAIASYTVNLFGQEWTPDIHNCFEAFGNGLINCSPSYAYPSGNGTATWVIDNNAGVRSYPYDFSGGMTQALTITNWTPNTPPPAPSSNAGIFFPKDEITGVTTASDLTASVGTATGKTVSSLTPVVVVVLGIILAFVGINVIIGLIYGTDDTKKKKRV